MSLTQTPPEEVFDKKEIGLLAQEVYTLFPEMVNKPADESKELWAMPDGRPGLDGAATGRYLRNIVVVI